MTIIVQDHSANDAPLPIHICMDSRTKDHLIHALTEALTVTPSGYNIPAVIISLLYHLKLPTIVPDMGDNKNTVG